VSTPRVFCIGNADHHPDDASMARKNRLDSTEITEEGELRTLKTIVRRTKYDYYQVDVSCALTTRTSSVALKMCC